MFRDRNWIVKSMFPITWDVSVYREGVSTRAQTTGDPPPDPELAKSARKLVAETALGLLPRDACVEWAVAALVQGWDSPSLRMLAGLYRPGWDEVQHYLELALRELSIPNSSGEQAVRAYLRDVAEDILTGAVAPVEGCHVIYRIAAQLDLSGPGSTWTRAWNLGFTENSPTRNSTRLFERKPSGFFRSKERVVRRLSQATGTRPLRASLS